MHIVQEPSLPRLALTILTVDFLRYAVAAGAVWLLVEVLLGRRLAGRRILDATRQPGQVRREFVYSLSTVLRWTPRGWLSWITPVSHHHFHHARNRGNYGLYFTWWDRWCGTEDAEYLRYGDTRFGQAASTAGEVSA